jgi:hypothetical protein
LDDLDVIDNNIGELEELAGFKRLDWMRKGSGKSIISFPLADRRLC